MVFPVIVEAPVFEFLADYVCLHVCSEEAGGEGEGMKIFLIMPL